MVAEPVIETEVTPAEEAAVAVPESPPESTPAPENPEVETSFGDAFLESIDRTVAENAGKDGQNAAPDAVVPPAQPQQPSAEQIRQDERNRVAAENRINGLKWVVADDAPAQLAKLRDELSPEGWETLVTQINRMKGAFQPLLDRAIDVDTNLAPQVRSAALRDAETFTLSTIAAGLKEVLGDDVAKAFTETNHGSWENAAKFIYKEARKDMVPKGDYVSRASVKQNTDKLDQSLKERGAAGIVTSSLRELMGSTGPDTPAATGGVGRLKVGTPEWAENASIEELIAAKAKGLY